VLPANGYDPGENTFTAPPADGSGRRGRGLAHQRPPAAARAAFAAWDGNDYVGLPVLMKAKGKCTTDHISMAGKWLKYRGHLENISGNLFIGAVNAFNAAVGTGKDPLDGETDSFPDIAKKYTRPACAGWPSATRTTARARRASTPRWSPASAAAR
jgi:aconitate hydratase